MKRFSMRVSGTFISSTELQNNINSSNPIEKDASVEMDGGFGYSLELMFDPRFGSSGIRFFISSEYFSHRQENLYNRYYEDTVYYSVKFREEFYFIPVEGGVKWSLPVSGNDFKVYIGGGGGMYFGRRKRTALGIETETVKVNPGYSLNVLSGIEYYIARNLSANFEFKFREAYFESEDKFPIAAETAFGLPNPFTSRIVVNGTTVILGFKYNF
jgi:hypothetical protein